MSIHKQSKISNTCSGAREYTSALHEWTNEHIVRNNNLRKQSFYSDNKHINKESINLLAGNIKHGLRKVLGIKLDKSRKAESKSPLSNQQNTTCNKELSSTAGTFAAFLHSIFQDFQGFQK